MKTTRRTYCVVAGAALWLCVSTAFCQTELARPTQPPTTTTLASLEAGSNDETNVSPRERGRILVKRNPIASEYQIFGDNGSSPGADSDAEGFDYRSYFPKANPLEHLEDSVSFGYSLNYNNLSGNEKHGADARFTKLIGTSGRWALTGQFRSSASDRLIEHYESVWQESEFEGESELYFLDRPRYSYDKIDTRNNIAALQIAHSLSDRHTVYFKTYYQDYFDNFYRNRLELQLGAGDLVENSVTKIEDQSVLSASFTNAKTRRYFGDTDNERTRQHNLFGGSYNGDEWNIDYSVYAQKWDLDSEWYDWNFNDFDLDLSYLIDDRYFPKFTVDSGEDILDTSNSRFSSLRLHNSFTRDRDQAARIDAERNLELGELNIWIQSGILHRTKRRETGETRDVLTANPEKPFYLSEIDFDTRTRIIDGKYEQQSGINPAKARIFLDENSDQFVFDAYRSEIESAPQSYNAEEGVTSAYFLGSSKRDRWTVELGGRLEYTATETRGTIAIPESVNDPNEGVFLKEIVDPKNGSTSIVKDLFSENDYTNFLPSVEASYEFNNQSKIRASWFQLLMRPQYFNIVDYRRISIPTRSISEGNPKLNPTSIDKLRLAWITESPTLGQLSIEGYVIDIENFFYGSVSTESILEDGEPVLYRVSRVENGESGRIKGFEIQWRKQFEAQLIFDQSSISLAYTYSDSEATVATRPGEILPVPDRSDHLLKASLSGTIGQFKTGLEFTYQSDALDDVGSSIEQDKTRENVIATTVKTSYAFNEKLNIYCDISNLSNHPERSYEGSPFRVTRNQYSSWYGVFGFRNQF